MCGSEEKSKLSIDNAEDASFNSDGPGLIRGCMEQIQEVTGRLQSQMESRFTQFVVDHMADAAFWVKPDGRFVYANESASEALGYSRDELCSMRVSDVDPDYTDDVWPGHFESLRQTGVAIFESTHKRRNGETFPVEIRANYFQFQGKEYDCAIVRDVSERKRVEEALRRNQAMLARAERIAQVGSWEWEVGTDTVTWSDEMFRIFDRDPADGVPALTEHPALCPPEDYQSLRGAIEAAVRDGAPFELEIHVLRKDGESRVCLARGSVESGTEKRAWRLYGSLQDIQDRKQAEAERARLEAQNGQLQKAESLGRMAGAIAHLFNNYLCAVIGNLELALLESPPETALRTSLLEAMRAARRSSEISELMLTYLGHSPGKQEAVDLSEVCRRYLQSLRNAVPAYIPLEIDLSVPGPLVRSNANQIQRVLSLLVTNGREAIGDREGRMTLTTKTVRAREIREARLAPAGWSPPSDTLACLEVSDTGSGISSKDIDQIFDPFFSTKFAGRGLGLATALGTVKAWNGAIALESTVGKGTTFRVLLPLADADRLHQEQRLPGTSPSVECVTVLVVDDQEMVRTVAATMLKRMGFSVLLAADGAEAVEVYRQNRGVIRCVITDLSMPGLDGWETLAALRKVQPTVPVILASGYDEGLAMGRDDSEQPQGFLQKPYSMDDLKKALGQALREGAC